MAGGVAAGSAAVGGAATGSAAVGGTVLEPPAGEGEERCTRGRKALPPCVFTILKPEKEKKGVGGGGGGGGGMNGHGQLMVLLNGWNKKIGKLMVGTRNRGFTAKGRSGRRIVGLRIFTGYEKFRSLENFQAENYSPAHYYTSLSIKC